MRKLNKNYETKHKSSWRSSVRQAGIHLWASIKVSRYDEKLHKIKFQCNICYVTHIMSPGLLCLYSFSSLRSKHSLHRRWRQGRIRNVSFDDSVIFSSQAGHSGQGGVSGALSLSIGNILSYCYRNLSETLQMKFTNLGILEKTHLFQLYILSYSSNS